MGINFSLSVINLVKKLIIRFSNLEVSHRYFFIFWAKSYHKNWYNGGHGNQNCEHIKISIRPIKRKYPQTIK